MAFKIFWSPEALGDLLALTSYIARDNPDAAERVGLAILHKVNWLEQHPAHDPPHPFPLPIRWGEGGRRSGEGVLGVQGRNARSKFGAFSPRSEGAGDK